MMTNYRICQRCHSYYLEVEFLVHRLAGYCTIECSVAEPRGIPSAESSAWKDGIAATSQRKRLESALSSSIPPRIWKFDMVHYPAPKGWQIENWRLEIYSI